MIKELEHLTQKLSFETGNTWMYSLTFECAYLHELETVCVLSMRLSIFNSYNENYLLEVLMQERSHLLKNKNHFKIL